MTVEQLALLVPVFMALIGLGQAYLAWKIRKSDEKVEKLVEHTNGMLAEIKQKTSDAANAEGRLQGAIEERASIAEVLRVKNLTASMQPPEQPLLDPPTAKL